MSSEKTNPEMSGGLLPLAPVEVEGDQPPPRPPRPITPQTQPEYPPEKQQAQTHDEPPPPSYEQGDFVPPPSEKAAPPPERAPPQTYEEVGSGSNQVPQTYQNVPSGSGQIPMQEKDFPPPPPGPPPAHSHPDPLKAHPIEPQTYTIPQYNPADPIFAPPPQPADSETPAPAVSDTTTEKPQKKQGWSERFTSLGMKAAAPINSLAHKLGSQSFLPETLDKECEKASSILKTFCAKGVYADPGADQPPTSTDPTATETNDTVIDPTKNKPKSRVIVTIPPKVISKAVGLAIFTTLRAGFNVSGATGSGVLIARLPDGSWGPPSGIQVHSVGGGFSIGLDIYDCVCVINSREALAAFTKTRVGLGTDLAVVAGPYGAGGAVEFGAAVEKGDKKKDEEKLEADKTEKTEKTEKKTSTFKPVFSYVKSRGFYAGIQIDGTVVVERKDANAAFYGDRVPVDKILKGEVPPQGPAGMWPTGARCLLETLKGAEAGMKDKDKEKETVPAPANDAEPPAYVDDGIQRPVADHKYK